MCLEQSVASLLCAFYDVLFHFCDYRQLFFFIFFSHLNLEIQNDLKYCYKAENCFGELQYDEPVDIATCCASGFNGGFGKQSNGMECSPCVQSKSTNWLIYVDAIYTWSSFVFSNCIESHGIIFIPRMHWHLFVFTLFQMMRSQSTTPVICQHVWHLEKIFTVHSTMSTSTTTTHVPLVCWFPAGWMSILSQSVTLNRLALVTRYNFKFLYSFRKTLKHISLPLTLNFLDPYFC